MESKIDLAVAKHVLWWFGDRNLGEEPGGFNARLIAAIAHADDDNRAKLSQVYPDYVTAMRRAQQDVWGVEWLRNIVKAALDQAEDIMLGELSWLDRMDGLRR